MQNEESNNYSPKFTKWSHIANIVIAITAILGLIYVYLQLDLFYSQTDTLNKSLIQSYRPIGFITFIDPGEKWDVGIEFLKGGKKEKLSFLYRPSMINKGNGILVNIGHMYYITKEAIEFRKKLLDKELVKEEIHFDWKYDYVRGDALLPNDTADVNIRFDNIEFEEQYYVYIIAFYEDQDGRLYDTVNKTFMKFSPTFWKEDRMRTSLTRANITNKFNAYSEIEKSILIEIIKERKHTMADYFTY